MLFDILFELFVFMNNINFMCCLHLKNSSKAKLFETVITLNLTLIMKVYTYQSPTLYLYTDLQSNDYDWQMRGEIPGLYLKVTQKIHHINVLYTRQLHLLSLTVAN